MSFLKRLFGGGAETNEAGGDKVFGEDTYKGFLIKAIELKAGSVLFFCYGTPHATGDNTTDTERAGLAYHFLCDDQTDESFYEGGRIGNPRPRLTGPKATGGFEEYGAKIAGTWEAEVANALGRK